MKRKALLCFSVGSYLPLWKYILSFYYCLFPFVFKSFSEHIVISLICFLFLTIFNFSLSISVKLSLFPLHISVSCPSLYFSLSVLLLFHFYVALFCFKYYVCRCIGKIERKKLIVSNDIQKCRKLEHEWTYFWLHLNWLFPFKNKIRVLIFSWN